MPGNPLRRFETITPSLPRALHQAVHWGWVRTNVADMAKLPRANQSRVNVPSLGEVREVIEAAEQCDPRLAPLLKHAALTGLRRGSLCVAIWARSPEVRDISYQHQSMLLC
jgi:hypothetical protein